MPDQKSVLITYPIPAGIKVNNDFSVRIRLKDGEWKNPVCYNVKIDMHDVRDASMVYFDCSGEVEIEVAYNNGSIEKFSIRPFSTDIKGIQIDNKIIFRIDKPVKLSIEVNGDRFHNLHIFANSPDENIPDPNGSNVIYYFKDSIGKANIIHIPFKRKIDIIDETFVPDILFFGPGIHYIEEILLPVKSGQIIYIAGGAVVIASLICENVKNVTIRGRGILYLTDLERFNTFRGIRINYSQNIIIDGITVINPPHYSIYIGESSGISIRNFKAFSCTGWADGIDCMSSSDIIINDVFLRNSDDCIAIYGHRWEFNGDSRNIQVKNSILWADVAHPMMIGTHGDYKNNGSIIENIIFDNIDILEHHEPQQRYMGCMAINAGDKNTVRNVRYENIRIEKFECGRLIDIKVIKNPDYNPEPGKSIENIFFKNITYNSSIAESSEIEGYDEERVVEGVVLENLTINGKLILDAESGNIKIGPYTKNIQFKK